MNTEDIIDPSEALARVKSLSEGDNTVEVIKTDDGLYRLTWVKNKKYTDFTGVERTDEVWTKEDGTMIACQDLELEHAKNIIRMMLRDEREARQLEALLTNQIGSILSELEGEGEGEQEDADEEPRVLH